MQLVEQRDERLENQFADQGRLGNIVGRRKAACLSGSIEAGVEDDRALHQAG